MSQLPEGVFAAQKKDGTVYYRSSVTYLKKHISLGSYPSPEEAHQAYKEASSLIRGVSQISINAYKKTHILPFEKWVCLINFRDNRMYFGTPIYVRPKFFYYYLSPATVLKLDIDDLFYFSSHKIMKRGGHYFAADFGMQVNILNRFGIKNYAVPGRDYRFLNGDDTDFRRENLEILNLYHGVLIETRNGKTVYRSRIHVDGYIMIGTYDTMQEAAIAYNKAIDILKKAGSRKNYVPNYIEDISAKTYADIYSALKVSSRLFPTSPNNR